MTTGGIIRGCSMKKETEKLIAWIKKILKNGGEE